MTLIRLPLFFSMPLCACVCEIPQQIMFFCRPMSRVSGWSTSQAVCYPMTAQCSRCSTTTPFRAGKLPGELAAHTCKMLIGNHFLMKLDEAMETHSNVLSNNYLVCFLQHNKNVWYSPWSAFSSAGGSEENILGISSVSRAAPVQLRGSGGSGNVSVLTFPLSTWKDSGATSSPETGPTHTSAQTGRNERPKDTPMKLWGSQLVNVANWLILTDCFLSSPEWSCVLNMDGMLKLFSI